MRPLSRLAELGAWWVRVRPEHLACNLAKGTRTDAEVRVALRTH